MKCLARNALITACAAALAGSVALQAQTPKSAPSPAKPAAAAPKEKTVSATPKKSAFDKPTMEAYVRHLFVWGPQIVVTVGNPKPSKELPGFMDLTVRASMGEASQDEEFLISKDGQRILRATIFDVAQNPFKAQIDKLKTEGQPAYGTSGAPVVIVVFADFECPHCKEEAKMLRENLLSAYPKQVRLYYNDFPLPMHDWAKTAAIAGRAIFKLNPDKYWTYHEWVFEHQADITAANFDDKLLEFARANGIDTVRMTRAIEEPSTAADVERSVAEGKSLGINSTPTLFVNGRLIPGNIPWDALRGVIDDEIEYQKTAHNAGDDCGCEVKLPSPVSLSN